ncbi:MAG: hypothetical protein RLZ50_1702, partial [Bacteroidota bacterium]
VVFSPTTTTTYTVTGTDINSCSNTLSQTVTVNVLPIVTITKAETSGTANNDATICKGATITLSGGGASTYSWTGGISDGVVFSPTTTTTYTVTGTDINSCSNTLSQTVTVNVLPTVTITKAETSGTANNDATICKGATITLSGGGASTYSWTGGITNSVAFAPITNTTYTVTGTDINSCSNTLSQTVTVNPLPIVLATATPVSGEVCLGSNATLTGVGASTYTYTGGVINATAFAPATTTTYTVTGTDANGCVNTNTKTITVNPLPIVSATATPVSGEVCLGSNATLTGVGASTYTYTGGVINATAFAPTTTTTYTVTGTDAKGCVNTNTKTITVNSLPAAPTVTNKEYCFNETAVPLTATNLANHNLGWYGTDASGGTSASTAPTPSTSIVGSSIYYVSQTNTANSCESPRAAININVKALPPTPTITSNSPVCEGAALTLNTANISGAIYYWEGVNGFTSSSVNPTINNATSAIAGNYSLKIKFNGCVSPLSTPLLVAVNPIPAAPTISSNSPIEEDKTLNLTASNVPGATYAWSGPNGFTSNIQNPAIVASFANAGSYYATLTLNGCTSANSSPIVVVITPKSSPVFQIPNAFTPNSDGHNDTFKIIENGYVTRIIGFKIFTKSGKLIFSNTEQAWDGRYAGVMLDSDVYIWIADFINKNNIQEHLTGTVLLLK